MLGQAACALQARGEQLLGEWRRDPTRLAHQTQQRQALALTLLNNVGGAELLAAAAPVKPVLDTGSQASGQEVAAHQASGDACLTVPHDLSHAACKQVALVEAMASTMVLYANKLTWKVCRPS
jgi:hypothetical protein